MTFISTCIYTHNDDSTHLIMMKKDTVWFRPCIEEQSLFWKLLSRLCIGLTMSVARVFLGYLNKITIDGGDRLEAAVGGRKPGQPLITISNHYSFADCLLTAKTVKWRGLYDVNRNVPLQPGAQEVTHRSFLMSLIFTCLRGVPVVRGGGVYQRGMDLLVEALNMGHWVHIFPEGRLNRTKGAMKFKSGVGRLIYECEQLPLILPYFHLGMDNVLPFRKPCYPRTGQCVTVLYGTPIDLQSKLQEIKRGTSCKETIHQLIADELEQHLAILAVKAQELHSRHHGGC